MHLKAACVTGFSVSIADSAAEQSVARTLSSHSPVAAGTGAFSNEAALGRTTSVCQL